MRIQSSPNWPKGYVFQSTPCLSHAPIGLTITRASSDVSNIGPTNAPPPPIIHFPEIPQTTAPFGRQQDNCSALACHLFAHAKNLRFDTKAEVAKWCRTTILLDILWRSSTLSLVKMAGQKVCRLCATELMIIGQNLTSSHRQRTILNLKSEMCGVCSRKARFLRFTRSE